MIVNFFSFFLSLKVMTNEVASASFLSGFGRSFPGQCEWRGAFSLALRLQPSQTRSKAVTLPSFAGAVGVAGDPRLLQRGINLLQRGIGVLPGRGDRDDRRWTLEEARTRVCRCIALNRWECFAGD